MQDQVNKDDVFKPDLSKPDQVLFGSATHHPMPDYSNYDLWDDYMAKVWSSLLKEADLGSAQSLSAQTIMEIAPGATFKIAKALSQINFSGKLILVEPNPLLAEKILQRTREILPQAKIQLLSIPFQELSLKEPVSAILSNHPFDDFLSASLVTNKTDLEALFQDITQESPAVLERLKTLWHENDNPSGADQRCQSLYQEWHTFLNRHPVPLVILSQYRSSYLDKHQLQIVNDEAQTLFQTLKTETLNRWPDSKTQTILNQHPHYQNQWIGTELLNAQNWLICQEDSISLSG